MKVPRDFCRFQAIVGPTKRSDDRRKWVFEACETARLSELFSFELATVASGPKARQRTQESN